MDKRIIFNITAKAIQLEALLLLLPAAVNLIYGEPEWYAFVITSLGAMILSTIVRKLTSKDNGQLYERESFVTVSLVWICFSVIGALPYVISGEIPNFCDAFFETVSGFTTTGSTILTDIEALSHGALFWRSFANWIGGMGILVLIVMLSSRVQGRSMMILKAELPGPIIGKLVPRARDTARILYTIYIAMSLVQVIMLLLGGMSLFDSVVHMFGTAGTGGFSTKTASYAAFNPYCQWVTAIFILLFGINFNLYHLSLKGKIRDALRSEELKVYLGIVLLSTVAVFLIIRPGYNNADAIRHSVFQVSSIITTTGYTTADFNLWPNAAKVILVLLMFIGGCAGSTAGGIKVSRVIIAFKTIRQEMISLRDPKRIRNIVFEGQSLNDVTVRQTIIYMVIYFFILTASTVLMIFAEPFNLLSSFTASLACLSNEGLILGTLGPASCFSGLSQFSKYMLSVVMLFGRLEIYPLLLTFSIRIWKDK